MKVIDESSFDKELIEQLKEFSDNGLIDMYIMITYELAKRGIKISQEYVKND